MAPIVPAAEALALHELVAPTEHGIASRVLVKADVGARHSLPSTRVPA